MLRDRHFAIEHPRARNFFQQLRPSNQQVAGIAARVERFDEELEKLWIHHEQLEEHTAQPVGFDKPDELVQRPVRIGGPREPSK